MCAQGCSRQRERKCRDGQGQSTQDPGGCFDSTKETFGHSGTRVEDGVQNEWGRPVRKTSTCRASLCKLPMDISTQEVQRELNIDPSLGVLLLTDRQASHSHCPTPKGPTSAWSPSPEPATHPEYLSFSCPFCILEWWDFSLEFICKISMITIKILAGLFSKAWQNDSRRFTWRSNKTKRARKFLRKEKSRKDS